MAEVARNERRAVDEPGVGGEHEVGHVRLRLEDLDLGTGGPQVGDERVPLLLAAVAVDHHLSVHPGVDLVEHAEMQRRAHEEPPSPAQLGHLC